MFKSQTGISPTNIDNRLSETLAAFPFQKREMTYDTGRLYNMFSRPCSSKTKWSHEEHKHDSTNLIESTAQI